MINKASRPCPFLGLADDPETSQGFASPNNYCHRAVPSAPVNFDHQLSHCLTSRYHSCPILREGKTGPLPPALQAGTSETLASRMIPWGVILGIAIVAGLIFLYSLIGRSQAAGQSPEKNGKILPVVSSPTIPSPGGAVTGSPSPEPGSLLPATGQTTATSSPTDVPLDSSPTGPVGTPTTAGQPTAVSDATEPNCGPPEGWVQYTVRSGDTLFGLSQVLGVSVAELQQANCLGANTVINVGQELYVPALPPISEEPTRPPTATGLPPTAPSATSTSPPPTPTPSPTQAPPTRTEPPPLPTDTPLPPTPTEPPPLRATATPTPTMTF